MLNKQTYYALALAEAISELGEVPNGHLYAAVMGKMSFGEYQQAIAALKAQKLIKEKGFLLTWIGPTPKES